MLSVLGMHIQSVIAEKPAMPTKLYRIMHALIVNSQTMRSTLLNSEPKWLFSFQLWTRHLHLRFMLHDTLNVYTSVIVVQQNNKKQNKNERTETNN